MYLAIVNTVDCPLKLPIIAECAPRQSAETITDEKTQIGRRLAVKKFESLPVD